MCGWWIRNTGLTPGRCPRFSSSACECACVCQFMCVHVDYHYTNSF